MVQSVRVVSAAIIAFATVSAAPNAAHAQRLDVGHYVRMAEAAQQGNDCTGFRHYLSILETPGEGLEQGERDELTRKVAELKRIGCPPRTATTAPGTIRFNVGGGVSSTQGIQVGNGNFNTDLNATGPAFQAGLSVPLPLGAFAPRSTFQARFFYFNGDSSTNLSGNAGIFNQANGLNQPINLNTTGQSSADLTHIGGEGLFQFDHPMHHLGVIFSPLFGAGFERVTLDTNTTVRIAGLGFHASDSRTTVTDRLFITGGLQAEFPALNGFPGAPTIVVFGNGRINFDHATGTAVYDTAQVGVFQEALRNEFSRNAVTFGGQIGSGVAWNFANGGRFEIKGSVGSVPLHELKFHPNQPATLEHSNHLNVAAGASLNIPLTGPRPFDLDATRNLTFR